MTLYSFLLRRCVVWKWKSQGWTQSHNSTSSIQIQLWSVVFQRPWEDESAGSQGNLGLKLLPCEYVVSWHRQPGPTAKLRNAEGCMQLGPAAGRSHLISMSTALALSARKGLGVEANRSGSRLWPSLSATVFTPREVWMVIEHRSLGMRRGFETHENGWLRTCKHLFRPSPNSKLWKPKACLQFNWHPGPNWHEAIYNLYPT